MISRSDGESERPTDGSIHRFKLPFILSNMYMVIDRDDRSAFVVDPVISDEAIEALERAAVDSVLIALTHEHFDHTCGIPRLRERFHCGIVCHEKALEEDSQKKNSRPVLAYMIGRERDEQDTLRKYFRGCGPFRYEAEQVCRDRLAFRWGGHTIRMRYAPGHSLASVLICFDEKYVFTGDSLIPDVPVVTRFPGGSMADYEAFTLPVLKDIDPGKMILPGHGEPVMYRALRYRDGAFRVQADEG